MEDNSISNSSDAFIPMHGSVSPLHLFWNHGQAGTDLFSVPGKLIPGTFTEMEVKNAESGQ